MGQLQMLITSTINTSYTSEAKREMFLCSSSLYKGNHRHSFLIDFYENVR